jgi:DNA polymerase I-like protein with 3'-5' exonuclease and polymerase domains
MGRTRASWRAGRILKCKSAGKEVELYTKLLKAGRFHAAFKVIGTLSSRMAGGEGLNAQGIKGSEEVRSAFPLKWPGTILCGGDFDGFEVTIADAVFGDAKLRKALLDGVSIHSLMAQQLYPEKTMAQIKASKGLADGGDVDMYTRGKQAVFATLYGGDASTINTKLNIPKKTAEKAFDGFQNEFPGIRETREKIAEQFQALKQHGEVGTGRITYKAPAEFIETFLGFRRYFNIENIIAKALFDLATNTPPEWRGLSWKVVRRDREQTPGGAISSALYGAAFQIQAATIRAANNHLIQSPGAMITKQLQADIWAVQPYGVNAWLVAPINVHDEVLVVTDPDYVDEVTRITVKTVESYRDQVPLIGMKWVKSMENWAGKKGGGENLEVHISPHGITGLDDDCYVEPMDITELEELEDMDDPCPDLDSLEEYV